MKQTVTETCVTRQPLRVNYGAVGEDIGFRPLGFHPQQYFQSWLPPSHTRERGLEDDIVVIQSVTLCLNMIHVDISVMQFCHHRRFRLLLCDLVIIQTYCWRDLVIIQTFRWYDFVIIRGVAVIRDLVIHQSRKIISSVRTVMSLFRHFCQAILSSCKMSRQ